jgi:hypothetical protein
LLKPVKNETTTKAVGYYTMELIMGVKSFMIQLIEQHILDSSAGKQVSQAATDV